MMEHAHQQSSATGGFKINGRAGAGGRGPSEAVLLRAELVRVWGAAGSPERLASDICETAGEATSSTAADLEDARDGIDERDRRISDLEGQLAVHENWDRDEPGDGNAPQAMTRAECRLASDRFEAAGNGNNPDSITRKPGAQPGRRGRAGGDRPEKTVNFRPETCRCCGRADLGSPRYDRRQVMPAVYRDARPACRQVERLAGGPIRCASRLGTVSRIPGLSEFADARIGGLTGRVRMISGRSRRMASPPPSPTPPHTFSAVRIPGMPLHNNGTERTIRDKLVVDRQRVRFPGWRAARNLSIPRTFAAACENNGISAYRAPIRMARDPAGISSPTEYRRPSPGEARRPRTSGRHPRSPPESGRVSRHMPNRPEPGGAGGHSGEEPVASPAICRTDQNSGGSLPHGLEPWVDLR